VGLFDLQPWPRRNRRLYIRQPFPTYPTAGRADQDEAKRQRHGTSYSQQPWALGELAESAVLGDEERADQLIRRLRELGRAP
jgi:hypothetical protein